MRVEWVPFDDALGAVTSGTVRNGALMLGILLTAERIRQRG